MITTNQIRDWIEAKPFRQFVLENGEVSFTSENFSAPVTDHFYFGADYWGST
jgi:hypothetical protein